MNSAAIHASAAKPAVSQRQDRVVLIGVAAFRQLKTLQAVTLAPRLDFRYLIEGLASTLQRLPAQEQELWCEAARDAMFGCLAARRGQPQAAAEGTGHRLQVAEGAPARTQDEQARPAAGRRQSDCRALQIPEATFQWLKAVQRTTSQPRIELRFLVEGALAHVQSRSELLAPVTGHARAALAAHLAALAAAAAQAEPAGQPHQTQSQTTPLEKTQ